MLVSPFSLLEKFPDILDVRLIRKTDDGAVSSANVASLLGTAKVLNPIQVHGAKVLRVTDASSVECDGIFTDTPGLTLALSWADCQNFIFFEPKKRVVGLVHGGWRGLAADILTNAVRLVKEEWSIAPADILAAAGPSLCKKCSEFTDPEKEVPTLQKFIDGRCIDLQAAAESELKILGITSDHFERMSDCTRCHPQRYWTYRGGDREAVAKGVANFLVCTLREA